MFLVFFSSQSRCWVRFWMVFWAAAEQPLVLCEV